MSSDTTAHPGVALAQGAQTHLLSRDVNGTVELTTHTFWESPAAIRAFAGHDITASVVEPEAQSALLDSDPTATHRSVLVDARG